MKKHRIIIVDGGESNPFHSSRDYGFEVVCLESGQSFFLNEMDQVAGIPGSGLPGSVDIPPGTGLDVMAEHYMDGKDGIHRCDGDHYLEGAVVD